MLWYNTSALIQTIYQVTQASLGGGIRVSKSSGKDSPHHHFFPPFLRTEYQAPTDRLQTAQ